MGEFKDGCKKVWRATKRFISDKGVNLLWTVTEIGIGAGIGYGICKVINACSKKDGEEIYSDEHERTVIDALPGYDDNWSEEYREDYDKVVAFSKELNMRPGEMYMIEDCTQYYNTDWYEGSRDGSPAVSHLIYGIGVYPPEETEES